MRWRRRRRRREIKREGGCKGRGDDVPLPK